MPPADVSTHAAARDRLCDRRFDHWVPAPAGAASGDRFEAVSARWLAHMDAAARTPLRAALGRRLAARGGAALQRRRHAAARDLVAASRRRGRLDVAGDLARPLALAETAAVLGLGGDRHRRLGELLTAAGETTVLAALTDPGANGPAAAVRRLLALAIQERWHEEGLLADLATAEAAGDCEAGDAVRFALLFLFAGHENVAYFVANAVLALAAEPAAWRRFAAADESWRRAALDELLRAAGPVERLPLYAGEAITCAAGEVAAGECVVVELAAANRDPEHYEHPDRLDLERRPRDHLAFGAGSHRCPGAALAARESLAALTALTTAVAPPDPETLAVRWQTASPVLRGPRHLWLPLAEDP